MAYRRALAAGGSYRCVGGSVRAVLRVVTLGWAISKVTGRSMGVLVVHQGPVHLEPLAELCVTGDVRIHIKRTFGLDEVPAALAHVGEGRALGKVVVIPCYRETKVPARGGVTRPLSRRGGARAGRGRSERFRVLRPSPIRLRCSQPAARADPGSGPMSGWMHSAGGNGKSR